MMIKEFMILVREYRDAYLNEVIKAIVEKNEVQLLQDIIHCCKWGEDSEQKPIIIWLMLSVCILPILNYFDIKKTVTTIVASFIVTVAL